MGKWTRCEKCQRVMRISENNSCENCQHGRYSEYWRGELRREQTGEQTIAFREILKASIFMWFLLFSAQTQAATGTEVQGIASWYSTEACRFNKDPRCPTASGVSLYELEARGVLFAASWYYDLGQRIRVCNQTNRKCVVTVILDRGPAKKLGRLVDLGKDAFSALDDLNKGVIEVKVDRLT